MQAERTRINIKNIEELRNCPAIFAENPHPKVSDKYTFAPTNVMLENLGKIGWHPIFARQSGRRNEFTKYNIHKVTLANTGDIIQKDDIIPNIIIYNCHNTMIKLVIKLGLFKIICGNGLVVTDVDMGEIKLKHQGRTFEEMQELVYDIVNKFKIISEKVNDYRNITLTEEAKKEFAIGAIQIAWGDNKKIEAASLLSPRREEDMKNDLFTVFNVVQENIIKGGTTYITEKNKSRRTRAIRGIMSDYEINTKLWMLMEDFRISKKR